MPRRKESSTGDTLVAGRSVDQWANRWRLVPGGFKENQPKLRGRRSLFAAKLGDIIMYIGVANNSDGGLNKGLARARHGNVSGDKGHGLRMIRENLDDLEAYVIDLTGEDDAFETTKELAKALKDVIDPVWNQDEKVVSAARAEAYGEKKN